MENLGFRPSRFGLDNHGLKKVERAHWNLGTPGLFEHALQRSEGQLTKAWRFHCADRRTHGPFSQRPFCY